VLFFPEDTAREPAAAPLLPGAAAPLLPGGCREGPAMRIFDDDGRRRPRIPRPRRLLPGGPRRLLLGGPRCPLLLCPGKPTSPSPAPLLNLPLNLQHGR
jgi:hypothetical protein